MYTQECRHDTIDSIDVQIEHGPGYPHKSHNRPAHIPFLAPHLQAPGKKAFASASSLGARSRT